MQGISRQLRRGELAVAAALPQLALGKGRKLRDPEPHLRQRRDNKIWAIYADNGYVVSTGARDLDKAEEFLRLWTLQDEARREGVVDVRNVPVTAIIDYHLAQIPPARQSVLNDTECRLRRLRPHIEGLVVSDLTGRHVLQIEQALLERYAPGTVCASIKALRTAIRTWCRHHAVPEIVPFDPPTRPPGRDRVLSREELDRVLRWADGSERYDVATGTWRKGRIGRVERHRRTMIGRLIRLGLATGSRRGRLKGLAWQPDRRYGHVDVERGVLHRTPMGTPASATKRAPAVALSPGLLAELRAWRKADGDARYLLRTLNGAAASADSLSRAVARTMRELGIEGVVLHSLRHTAITCMIEAAVPASVIAAVVGVSLQVLRTTYNHSDETAVHPLAHASMDAMIRGH